MLMTTAIIFGIISIFLSALISPLTIHPLSWEYLSRSQANDPMTFSTSPLLAAIRNRYEEYIRPFVWPEYKRIEKFEEPSEEYLEVSGLLEEMVDSNSSYVKAFVYDETMYLFTLKKLNLLGSNESIESERFPIIGKMALFSIPMSTLLNNEKKLKLKLEQGLELCWKSYIPGLPFIVSFSNDNKQLAIGYQQVIEGGIRYRIRYFHTITCNPIISSTFQSEVYEKYVNLTLNFQDELTDYYDDLYIDISSNIISLAVGYNKIAYGLYYDIEKFHVLEKLSFSNMWIERQNAHLINRSNHLYEFSYDLYMIEKNNVTLLLAFTRKGDLIKYLDQDIDIYEFKSIQDEFSAYLPIMLIYNSHVAKELPLTVSLPTLYSSNRNSHYIVDKDKSLITVYLNKDKGVIIPLPFDSRSADFDIKILPQDKSVQAMTATKNMRITVTYTKTEDDLSFHFQSSNSIGNVITNRGKEITVITITKIFAQKTDSRHHATYS